MAITNNRWTIYIHIVPKDLSGHKYDKYYVGITSRTPEIRWGSKGLHYKKSSKAFWNAIEKYGWDNIEHLILATNLYKEDAEKLEQLLIKDLKSNKQYGYNISNGGSGGNNKATRKVAQYSLDGKLLRIFNSCADASRFVGCDRNIILNSCKKHFRQSHGYIWRFENDPEIIVTKKSQKTVYMYDLDGFYIRSFKSLDEASKLTNIPYDSISSTCIGKNKIAYGYIFKYVYSPFVDSVSYSKNHNYCLKN